MFLFYNKNGLCVTVRRFQIALAIGDGRAGIIVRLVRTHRIKDKKLDKLNYWLNRIVPGSGKVEVSHNDLRCLALTIPGPTGTFWWCLRP